MNRNHDLLAQLEKRLHAGEPTGHDLSDTLAGTVPHMESDFQQHLEDQLLTELRRKQTMQQTMTIKQTNFISLRWLLTAAALLMIGLAGFLFLQNDTLNNAAVTSETTEEFNISLFQRYIDEAWNQRHLDTLDSVLATDQSYHDVVSGELSSMATFIAGFHAGFPDLAVTIQDISADGDWVWAQVELAGTQANSFPFATDLLLPASQQTVTLNATYIARLENGKIVELWVQGDTYQWLQEMDAISSVDAMLQRADNMETARRVIDDLWNNPDPRIAVVGELYGRSVNVWMSADEYQNYEYTFYWKQQIQAFRDAFPDLHLTVENITADGDFVMLRYIAEGTWENDFCSDCQGEPVPASGESIKWGGTFTYQFNADGEIDQEWWHMDFGLMWRFMSAYLEGMGINLDGE